LLFQFAYFSGIFGVSSFGFNREFFYAAGDCPEFFGANAIHEIFCAFALGLGDGINAGGEFDENVFHGLGGKADVPQIWVGNEGCESIDAHLESVILLSWGSENSGERSVIQGMEINCNLGGVFVGYSVSGRFAANAKWRYQEFCREREM
jgi:hypothetical protein